MNTTVQSPLVTCSFHSEGTESTTESVINPNQCGSVSPSTPATLDDSIREYVQSVSFSDVHTVAMDGVIAYKLAVRNLQQSVCGYRSVLYDRFKGLWSMCTECGLTAEQTLATLLDASRGSFVEASAQSMLQEWASCRPLEWMLSYFQRDIAVCLCDYEESEILIRRENATILSSGSDFPNPSRPMDVFSTKSCLVDRSYYIPYFIRQRSVIILRPKGFGKTLWLNTLIRFFTRPESFRDSSIYRMAFRVGKRIWNPSGLANMGAHSFEPLPVLSFDFSEFDYRNSDNLERDLTSRIGQLASEYAVDISVASIWTEQLRHLIDVLNERSDSQGVVVLVDNYDFALLNRFEFPMFYQMLRLHVLFYSVLKSSRKEILLTYVTGISAWMLSKLRPGADHLRNLTLDDMVSQLFGFTDVEVRALSDAYALRHDTNPYDRLVESCSGHCFSEDDEKHQVFHPLEVATELSAWGMPRCCYQTGVLRTDSSVLRTDSSVVKQYWRRVQETTKMARIEITKAAIVTSDPCEDDPGASFMMYLGYLTIKKVVKALSPGVASRDRVFTLDYPNSRARLAATMDCVKYRVAPMFNNAHLFSECLACSPPRITEFFGRLNSDREGRGYEGNDLLLEFRRDHRCYRARVEKPGLAVCVEIPSELGSPHFILETSITKKHYVSLVVEVVVQPPGNEDPVSLAEHAWIQLLKKSHEIGKWRTQKAHFVAVVLRPGTLLVDCIMFRTGAYERYDLVEGKADLFEGKARIVRSVRYPARNAYFLTLLMGLLRCKGVSASEVANLDAQFLSHGINALSLISLNRGHMKKFGCSTSLIDVIENIIKLVKPTRESLLDGQRGSESKENQNLWVPQSWDDVASLASPYFDHGDQVSFLSSGDLAKSRLGTYLAILSLEQLFRFKRLTGSRRKRRYSVLQKY